MNIPEGLRSRVRDYADKAQKIAKDYGDTMSEVARQFELRDMAMLFGVLVESLSGAVAGVIQAAYGVLCRPIPFQKPSVYAGLQKCD